jgi:hypothetical protein
MKLHESNEGNKISLKRDFFWVKLVNFQIAFVQLTGGRP